MIGNATAKIFRVSKEHEQVWLGIRNNNRDNKLAGVAPGCRALGEVVGMRY